ncbi:MAG: serine protease Do [Gammaproteobacteria bacterium]|jgi:serine protease Do
MKIPSPSFTAQTIAQATARATPVRATVAALSLGLALFLPTLFAGPTSAASAATEPPVVTVKRQGFADLVERVQPAVVNVATRTRVARTATMEMPLQFPEGSPFAERFREFFERNQQQTPNSDQPQASGVGSGFIVDANGFVVTNHHVIKGADEIILTLSDGTEMQADVVGFDSKTDLALLKVQTDEPLPYVNFGDSRHARVGDWVVAVGSPFGLGGTVTAGILSARGRDIHSGPFDDFLQVDAPINRGNSGGPLFDETGQVIGVNTAIFSPSGGSVGIGFAIPSEIAADVISALKEDGHVKRGWMGVNIQGLSPELARSFGLDAPRGALVAGVLAGSPAAGAGIEVGDIIERFDDKEITKMRDLPRAVAATKAGRDVDVKILRNGKPVSLRLNVGNMPVTERQAAAAPASVPANESLGVRLSALDVEMRSRLGLSASSPGVLITEVAKGSPAAREGLRPGDLIVRVGNGEVTSPAQVTSAMKAAVDAKRDRVLMLISRNGNERFVAVPFKRG